MGLCYQLHLLFRFAIDEAVAIGFLRFFIKGSKACDKAILIFFFPALFGACTLWVVWKTIEELKGDLFAMVLGAICILFSSLLRVNTLYQPNSFDILSWTTIYFVVIKYFNTQQTKWLFVAAAVFAFGENRGGENVGKRLPGQCGL